MTLTIARAEPADLDDVLSLLNERARWLRLLTTDQWQPREGDDPDEPYFGAGRIGPYVARAEVWLVRDGDFPAGTFRLTPDADLDFWTSIEASESALYLSKLATSLDPAYTGLGELMMRWAADFAYRLGYDWLRLDAHRGNAGLQRYYADRGFTRLRTVPVPGRRSGALFFKPALADPAARKAFADRSVPAQPGNDISYGVMPGRDDHGYAYPPIRRPAKMSQHREDPTRKAATG